MVAICGVLRERFHTIVCDVCNVYTLSRRERAGGYCLVFAVNMTAHLTVLEREREREGGKERERERG